MVALLIERLSRAVSSTLYAMEASFRCLLNAPRRHVRPTSQRTPPIAARANVEGSGTANENMTPLLFAPPAAVIPYNVDPLSVKLHSGVEAVRASKAKRVVGVPPVTGMLKIVPPPFAPPSWSFRTTWTP